MNQKNYENSCDQVISDRGPAYRSSLPYLLAGGAIGATLALLFAPKPGNMLRSEIADVSRKGLDKVRDKAWMVNEKSGDIANTVKEFASRRTGHKADISGNSSMGGPQKENPLLPVAIA